nr:unnamed protein product [Callosobruchus analis]
MLLVFRGDIIGNYDETIKSNLNESTVFRGTSNQRNDRIENNLISDVVLDQIKFPLLFVIYWMSFPKNDFYNSWT